MEAKNTKTQKSLQPHTILRFWWKKERNFQLVVNIIFKMIQCLYIIRNFILTFESFHLVHSYSTFSNADETSCGATERWIPQQIRKTQMYNVTAKWEKILCRCFFFCCSLIIVLDALPALVRISHIEIKIHVVSSHAVTISSQFGDNFTSYHRWLGGNESN